MNSISIRALDLGLAVKQAALGAQEKPFIADQRLFLWDTSESPRSFGLSARDGLRVNCSNPPNAIKVGASSDRRTA
jgi:hypothetical protein